MLQSLDLTLGKRIKFDESRNLKLRLEAQNATNTPSFGLLGGTPTDVNLVIARGNFGLVGGNTVSGAQGQIAAKINF